MSIDLGLGTGHIRQRVERILARTSSISKFKKKLAKSLEEDDWNGFLVARDRLMELVLGSARDMDDVSLKEIENVFAHGYASMIFRHNVDPSLDKSAATWIMRADTMLVEIARRFVPRAPAQTDDKRGVRDKILLALARTNQRKVNNSDLARLCQTTEETVSRIIPSLSSEGLISTEKAGSRRLNNLTDKGREVVSGLVILEERNRSKENTLNDRRSIKEIITSSMQHKAHSHPSPHWRAENRAQTPTALLIDNTAIEGSDSARDTEFTELILKKYILPQFESKFDKEAFKSFPPL